MVWTVLLPDFYGNFPVPRKWHSGTQTSRVLHPNTGRNIQQSLIWTDFLNSEKVNAIKFKMNLNWILKLKLLSLNLLALGC